jgi:hypothetical protein
MAGAAVFDEKALSLAKRFCVVSIPLILRKEEKEKSRDGNDH